MAGFLNHVTISAPRNTTSAHTVSPTSGTVAAGTYFTPTVGRYLLCICEGGVTSYGPSPGTPPSGWDTASEVIGNTGLYAWVKVATGSDAVVLTHNGSNYPIVCDFYEFPAGTTFVDQNHGSVSKTSTNVAITGLTGTRFCIGAKDQGVGVFDALSYSAVWDGASVESIDVNVAGDVTDGCYLTVGYSEAWTSATYAPTATVTSANGTTCEVLSVALNVPAGVNYNKILDQRVVAFGTSVGSGDYTSSSFTTQAGTVLVAIIGYGLNGNSSTFDYDMPRPTTSGLTWKPRCRRFTTGNFSAATEIWVADNASAGSKTIAQAGAATWDTAIKTIDVVVLELFGAAAATLQGNPFVVGGRIYGTGVDPGAQTLTLPVAPEATSLVVAGMTNYVYSTSTAFSVTPGADMTEVADHANGLGDSNNILFQAQVRGGSTSQAVAWQDIQAGGSGGDTYAWALVAAEFKQAGSTPNSQAVRFNGSTSFYHRTAYGFPASTDFSLTFWLRMASDRNTYTSAVAFGDAGSNYAHFGAGSTGTLLGRDTTGGGANTGYDMAATLGTQWVYFANAFTVAGAGGSLLWTENELQLVNGYSQSTPWNWMTTALDFRIGNDTFNGYFDGSVAAVKMWTACLTYDELRAEQYFSAPVRTANFFAWYPFNAGPSTADAFGSRTLTANGTPTLDTYGPPIVYANPIVPSGLFTDNFNRADTTTVISGGVGLNGVYADWDGQGWKITSNKAERIGGSSDYCTFATTMGSPDHYVEADYDNGGLYYCVVNLRRPSAANVETGYLGYVDPGGYPHIAKTVDGSFSGIAGGDLPGGPFATTGRIRLEASGTLLTLKINGATVGSVNDSTITTGNYVGMNASSLGLMDNFAAGPTAAPTMFLTPTRSTVTLA